MYARESHEDEGTRQTDAGGGREREGEIRALVCAEKAAFA